MVVDFPEVGEEEGIKVIGSKCIRCGKPRIVTASYEEVVQTSTIIHTEMECSDPNCQKLVNKTLKVEEDKRHEGNLEKERRERIRKRVTLRKNAAKASK